MIPFQYEKEGCSQESAKVKKYTNFFPSADELLYTK